MNAQVTFSAEVDTIIGKLRATKGQFIDGHRRGVIEVSDRRITHVAVLEREGDQFVIPVYLDFRSCVNPLVDSEKQHVTLSPRTIGGVIDGRLDHPLDAYNADEFSLGKFVSGIIEL